MKFRFLVGALAGLAGLAGMPALAEDFAAIIANSNYRYERDLASTRALQRAVGALQSADITVDATQNASRVGLNQVTGRLATALAGAEAEGAVVLLSGRFVTTGRETYFLPVEARRYTVATLPQLGMPVSVLVRLLSEVPGRAVLILAHDGADAEISPYVRQGIGEIDLPQGVTLVTTSPVGAAQLMRNQVAVEGADLSAGVAALGANAAMRGYAPEGFAFLAAAPDAAAPVPDAAALERAYWLVADDMGTEEAYRRYLERYPRGIYVAEAEAGIDATVDAQILTAEQDAEAGEVALALSRAERREVQAGLTAIGYDTRGVDGIFGRGSRAAIAAWQDDSGYPATTYLNAETLLALRDDVARKAAEDARADRLHWRATGSNGTEEGLRAYLERYPNGTFSELAEDRLEPFEAARRAASDDADWTRAESAGTATAYRAYIAAHPDGAYVTAARSKIAALEQPAVSDAAIAQARTSEARLNLNGFTRRLIEQRLAKAGYPVGRVDGRFDADTRRGIAAYQTKRRLKATGYVTQTMVVQMLAEGVLQ